VSPFSLLPEAPKTGNQLDYVIPENQELQQIVASLQNSFSVRILDETVCHRVFFDTFDWRLYNSGAVLEVHEGEGPNRRIYWRAGKDDELRIQPGLNHVPHFAGELPPCEFRRQLQSVSSVRELLPRIKIKIKRLPLTIVDSHDKVVVRLNLDEYWFYPSKTRAGIVLGQRLTIKAVKGYRKAFEQVEAFFMPMDLQPAQDNMLKLALAGSGMSTSEYSTKLNLFLDPDMPAEEALKEILYRLLEIIQQNTAGCIKGRDIEFMHDYRVAIRKTRSALTQVENVLPSDIASKYNQFFSTLGKLTNPIRDHDVFMLKMESYETGVEKSLRSDLQPLRTYLEETRAAAQQKFVEFVKSAEYRQTVKDWGEYLQNPDTADPRPDNAAVAVYKLANKLVWDMYNLVVAEGNKINDDSTADALHDLRKSCKKLRYLMEFFQSLYPVRRIRELIEALKGLQDNLGSYNDIDVHIGILKCFIEQCSDSNASKACEKLIRHLEQKQLKTRSKFAANYAIFSSTENQDEFMELFVNGHQAQV
jgi:CHAD domain-containing protein